MAKKSILSRTLLSAALGLPLMAHAVTYSALEIGSLGGSLSYAHHVNASGQVVGTSSTADGRIHAFMTGPNGQGMRDLGILSGPDISGPDYGSHGSNINDLGQVVGGSSTGTATRSFITGANGQGMIEMGTLHGWSEGIAVNASGQVAGNSFKDIYKIHAFITDANGQGMRDLGTLGGRSSFVNDINASGQVTGYSTSNDATGYEHAFITGPNGEGMRDLGTLNGDLGQLSEGFGINASGQVVGFSMVFDPDSEINLAHAFITGPNGEGMRDLGAVKGMNSFAYDVNDLGQVTGFYQTLDDGKYHPFITGANGMGMVDLNSLLTNSLFNGDVLTIANGINNAGQIVAQGASGRSYLLTPSMAPVPEPESYALTLAGLGALAMVRKRKLSTESRL